MRAPVFLFKREGGWVVVSVLICRLSFHVPTFHHHLKHSLPLVLVSGVSLVPCFCENKSLVFSEPVETWLQSRRGTYWSSYLHKPVFKQCSHFQTLVIPASHHPAVFQGPLPFWEFCMVNIWRFLLSWLLLLSPLSIFQSTVHFHFQILSSAIDAFLIPFVFRHLCLFFF